MLVAVEPVLLEKVDIIFGTTVLEQLYRGQLSSANEVLNLSRSRLVTSRDAASNVYASN